jgi:hypothetical protein
MLIVSCVGIPLNGTQKVEIGYVVRYQTELVFTTNYDLDNMFRYCRLVTNDGIDEKSIGVRIKISFTTVLINNSDNDASLVHRDLFKDGKYHTNPCLSNEILEIVRIIPVKQY